MSGNGKGQPSTRPSAASRMARAKARSLHRARSRYGDASGPAGAPQAPAAPAPVGEAPAGRTPERWSPDLYAVERTAYARRKPELLREAPGKYVVFVGEEMIGPFDDLPSALKAAYGTFGYRRLYAKRVLAEDPAAEAGTVEPCRS